MTAQECSEAELGAAPVPAIPVVSDRVIGTVADPVGQRAILLDLLGVRLVHGRVLAALLNRDRRDVYCQGVFVFTLGETPLGNATFFWNWEARYTIHVWAIHVPVAALVRPILGPCLLRLSGVFFQLSLSSWSLRLTAHIGTRSSGQ